VFLLFEVLTVFLAAVAMSLALAHALEMPGKMRLPRDAYLAVQTIYYPGFTIGGLGEFAAVVAAFLLLLRTPSSSPAFWWMVTGFAALAGMQLTYWLFTQPVNSVWLKGEKLTGAGAGFFSLFAMKNVDDKESWTALRDRWEYSHVARAIFSVIAVLALLVAIAI
jgi:hypothetical protein